MKKTVFITAAFLIAFTAIAQDKTPMLQGGLIGVSSYRTLTGDGSQIANSVIRMRDGIEAPMLSSGAYIAYRKPLSNRWVLNAGLTYERLGYQQRLQVTFVTPPAPNAPTEVLFKSIHQVIRIPIRMDYYVFRLRKINWYLTGGLSTDYRIHNYVKRIDFHPDGTTSVYKNPEPFLNPGIINVSAIFGGGADYNINSKVGLTLNMQYAHNIFAMNSDPVRIRLQWASLNLGVNYKLSRKTGAK